MIKNSLEERVKMCQYFLLGDWGTPQNLKKKSEVDL